MANLIGQQIKEARSRAKLSQEKLAAQIEGLSAGDLGKAERGEKELSQSILRQIAKITGVTQASLINAAKVSSYSTASPAKKPAAGKTASTTAKNTAAKTSAATAKKTSAAKNAAALTAAEKKLVELYRAADADTKKKAVAVLKGESTDAGDLLSNLIGSAIDMLGKK